MNKDYRNLQKKLLANKGFSLVELLIAMLILMLIVFAFTPLLVGSIERLQYAGDKTEAVYLGQSDIEEMIVKQQTMGGDEITIELSDPVTEESVVTLEVSGGYFEAIQEKGGATAWLSSFIPYVPTIELRPDRLIEGYADELELDVLGRETKLEEDHDITLLDSNGNVKENYTSPLSLDPEPDEPGYDQVGSFELDEGLPNHGSPYVVQMEWEIEEGIDITVQSKFKVGLPYAVVVGEDQSILVTTNLTPEENDVNWKIKPGFQPAELGTIEDIVWTGFEYVAVTSSGRALVIQNREEPVTTTINEADSLKSIDYGDLTLITVGESGLIYTSRDGLEWNHSPLEVDVDSDLYTVSWDSDEDRVVAGGEDGTILYSDDLGENWHKGDLNGQIPEEEGESITFYGLTHGNGTWIAVGEDEDEDEGEGVIFKSSDGGVDWDQVDNDKIDNNEDTIFYGVSYDYDENRFMAVGTNGVIIVSANGKEWDAILQSQSQSLTDYDLLSVLWNEEISKFLITGRDGTILVGNDYEDESNWDIRTGSGDLKGAAVR